MPTNSATEAISATAAAGRFVAPACSATSCANSLRQPHRHCAALAGSDDAPDPRQCLFLGQFYPLWASSKLSDGLYWRIQP